MNQPNFRAWIFAILATFYAAGAAQAQSCDAGLSAQQIQQKRDSFYRGMVIAKSRGDVAEMNKLYNSFYSGFLEGCSDELKMRYCDYECHIQMIEYKVFLGNDLMYYYSKANPGSTGGNPPPARDPASLSQELERAIQFADRAKIQLALMQNSSTTAPNAYRNYVMKSSQLNTLVAKAYMSMGDRYYQSVSNLRLERLLFIRSSSVSLVTGKKEDKQEETEFDLARAFYEKAVSQVMEASLEIPDSTDPDLVSAKNQLAKLDFQLQRRRHSIKKGLIFLDIDPEEYKDITTNQFYNYINEKAERIAAIEQKMDQLIKEWLLAKGGNDTEAINNERYQENLSLQASAYKIAKMENTAASFKEGIDGQLAGLQNKGTGYQAELQRAQSVQQMRINIQELKNQLSAMRDKKAIDVLSFKEQTEAFTLDNIRWLINFDMAVTNLNLQMTSIEQEILEYQGRIEKNNTEINRLGLEKTANVNRKAMSDSTIELAKATKLRLAGENGEVYRAKREAYAAQVCDLESQLQTMGHPVSSRFSWKDDQGNDQSCTPSRIVMTEQQYHDKFCGTNGLQKKMAANGIASAARLLKCVVGVSKVPADLQADANFKAAIAAAVCGSNDTLDVNAQAIMNAENAEYQAKVRSIRDQARRVRELLGQISRSYTDAKFDRLIMKNVIGSVKQLMIVAASLPKTEVTWGALAGPMGGAITLAATEKTMDEQLLQSTKAAVDRFQNESAYRDFVNNFAEREKELQNQIEEIDQSVDVALASKNLAGIHTAKAIIEITGRQLDLSAQVQEALIKSEITTFTCQQQQDSYAAKLTQTQAKLSSVLATIEALDRDQALGVHDVTVQDQLINRENSSKAITDLSTQQLELQIKSLHMDNNRIDSNNIAAGLPTGQLIKEGLIQKAQLRKNELKNLLARVETRKSEADAKVEILNQIRSDKFRNSMALSDKEAKNLENIIESKETVAKDIGSIINSIENNDKAVADLKTQLSAFNTTMLDAINVERDNALNQVTKSKAQANPFAEVFYSTHEMIAALSKGIPDYIDSKQALLETVNTRLVQLRNRLKAFTSLNGKSDPLSLSSASGFQFVFTHEDIQKILDDLRDRVWDNNAQLNIETVTIPIPYGSPFYQDLLTRGKASFRISPAVANTQISAANPNLLVTNDTGHYMVWREKLGKNNAVLVDMLLHHQEGSDKCEDEVSRVRVTHSGSGFQFVGDSKAPQFITTRERSKLAVMNFKGASSDYFAPINNYWGGTHTLLTMLSEADSHQGPPNDASKVFPLLGMPVVGTYEINLPTSSDFDRSTCLGTDVNNLYIYLVFASKAS